MWDDGKRSRFIVSTVSGQPMESTPESPPGPEERAPRKLRFPTAFTVLFIVLLLVWIASFWVPAGTYNKDSSGSPIPGTYHHLPSCDAKVATAPALDVQSPTESGQAPADAQYAPGATFAEAGLPCVDDSFTFKFKELGTRRRTASTGRRTRRAMWGRGNPGSSTARR